MRERPARECLRALAVIMLRGVAAGVLPGAAPRQPKLRHAGAAAAAVDRQRRAASTRPRRKAGAGFRGSRRAPNPVRAPPEFRQIIQVHSDHVQPHRLCRCRRLQHVCLTLTAPGPPADPHEERLAVNLRLLAASAPIATLSRTELATILSHAACIYDGPDGSPAAAPLPTYAGASLDGTGSGQIESAGANRDTEGIGEVALRTLPVPIAAGARPLLTAVAAGLLMRSHKQQRRWEAGVAATVADERLALVTEHVAVASLLETAAALLLRDSADDIHGGHGAPLPFHSPTAGSTARGSLADQNPDGDSIGQWSDDEDASSGSDDGEVSLRVSGSEAAGVLGDSNMHEKRLRVRLAEFGAAAAAALSVVRDFPQAVLQDCADVLAPALEAAEHAAELKPVGPQDSTQHVVAEVRDLAAAATTEGLDVTFVKAGVGLGTCDRLTQRTMVILEPREGGGGAAAEAVRAVDAVWDWSRRQRGGRAKMFVVLADRGDLVTHCARPGPTPALRLLQHEMFEPGSAAERLPAVVLDARTWRGLPAAVRPAALRMAAREVLDEPELEKRSRAKDLPPWMTPVRRLLR